MRQSTRKIMGSQKNILALAGELFQNINIKVDKSKTTLNSDEILPAGTFVDKDGKVVNDSTAFGVVYSDVEFKDSHGTEIVPVTIFGFIKESELPVAPTNETKEALKIIKFL